MPQKNKTAPTAVDPHDFVGRVDDEQKRKDSEELITMMQKITGDPPRMWGSSIVGFGVNKYKYASGHEGEICLTGFSPRKQSLVLYLGEVLADAELMARLGKHKTGKGCLYIKTLDDVDRKILKEVVTKAVAMTHKRMKAK